MSWDFGCGVAAIQRAPIGDVHTVRAMVADLATVSMERPRVARVRDLLRTWAVEVDGHVIGRLGYGEAVSIDVEPGEHSVVVRAGLLVSHRLEFNLAANERRYLECVPGGHPWTALLDMVRPGGWVTIREAGHAA